MILKVKNLDKKFQQGNTIIHAVNNISFDINAGQTLAIVGPSGCGKTTLLSLLSGLEKADAGEIQVADLNITNMDEKALSAFRAKKIAIVFQQFHLMPHLTAEENVALPLEIIRAKDIPEEVDTALRQVGLIERKHHLPHELSGGECQRIAIARAMVVKPKVLFADEPSGNLDIETGKKIMDLLFDLVAEQNMTLVLVTHDHDLALRCQRQLNLISGMSE